MNKPGVVLKRPVASEGSFREHAELPKDLGLRESNASKPSVRKARKSSAPPDDAADRRRKRMNGSVRVASASLFQRASGSIFDGKDAFDRWWELVEKPSDSPLTIPAYLHDAVMQLPPDDGLNRGKVNEAVRLADAQR